MSDLTLGPAPLWPRVLLWTLVALLCGFGLVMVASTTAVVAGPGPDGREGAVQYGFVIKQLAAMTAGLIGAILVSWGGIRWLRHPIFVTVVGVVALLSLVAVLGIGRSINGARRWIDLGPINLQPAELAKLALVVAGAWYFSRVAEAVRSTWHGVLLPLAGFAVLAGLVFLTKDLGSVVVLFAVLAALVVWAGAAWWYFLALTILALPFMFFHAVFREAYRWERIMAFLDPFHTAGPAGYHLSQSLISIGSGGWWGVGLGNSTAKLHFLPERHTDFIFSIICEELGLVGGLGLSVAFLALVCVGLAIAWRARDEFARLLAVGAVVVLGTQAFWNVLMATGVVPTKGLTLPFISYGGSSVVVCLVLVGLLDAVARDAPSRAGTGTPRRGATARTARVTPPQRTGVARPLATARVEAAT